MILRKVLIIVSLQVFGLFYTANGQSVVSNSVETEVEETKIEKTINQEQSISQEVSDYHLFPINQEQIAINQEQIAINQERIAINQERLPINQKQLAINPQQRKKIGVVLSGGGAKGFAHVGVLKVLEEAGIPIDYIAGTSMGAVVGGLYAVGYSADMIDSLIQIQDWNKLMRDVVERENIPMVQRNNYNRFVVSLPFNLPFGDNSGGVTLPPGVYSGQNIFNLFLNSTIGYQGNINFDDLPIPFGCVAADVRTGKDIMLREGNLAEAIRASMAIPGVFTPVEKDDMLLVDGGLVNNYPVDLVRSMGADIVIGSIFPIEEEVIEQSKGSISEITQQIWNFIGVEKRTSNVDNTDILITPDIYPYHMMDFQRPAIDTIITRGVTAAKKSWDDLITLKEWLNIDESAQHNIKKINNYINLNTFNIRSVTIEGIPKRENNYLYRWIDIEDNKITRKELDQIIAKIYGSGLFTKVHYRLEGTDPFDLVFIVDVKESNRLNLGIHFDSNDMAAILANSTIKLNSSLNSMFDLTTRLSRDSYLMIDYSINSGIFYKGGINYKISRNDLNIYERGNLSYILGLTKNTLNLVFSEFYFRNLMLHLGAQIDHFHFFKALGSTNEPPRNLLVNQLYINYLINGTFDNLNNEYFPSSGQYFSFQYSVHTDNFVSLNDHNPTNIAEMNFFKPISMSDKVFITPRVAARYILNDSVPLVYRNIAGGRTDRHYIPQQISIQGSKGMELLENMVLTTDVSLHYNFRTNNYLYTNLNIMVHDHNIYSILKGDYYLGINMGYSYLTVAGPLRLELGYSGLSKRLHPYVSYGYYF